MHMADALLSPAVGGVMYAASAAATVYSVKKVKENFTIRLFQLIDSQHDNIQTIWPSAISQFFR